MRNSTGRWAFRGTLALAALLALDRFLFVPLHEQGTMQDLLSGATSVIQLIDSPGRWTAGKLLPLERRHPGLAGWALASLLTCGWVHGALRLAGAVLSARPEQASRRRFLRTASLGALGACAAAGGFGVLIEPRRLQVVRFKFPLRGLDPGLDGLRLVQLTDIHLGPWTTLEYVQGAVAIANGLEPDLILLTGDYVHRSPAYIEPVARALRPLRARIGIAGVLGNHDWWEDGRRVQRAFADAGLPLIDNSRRFVTRDRKLVEEASEGLCIAGVGDLWEDEVDFDRALAGVPEAMPRILLSHNPDAAEEPGLLESRHRVDLMLSGHTHGGQVRIPLLGTPVVPSRFGQKYAHGLVQGPACRVLIPSGVGMTTLPVRFGVRPEIALIELERA